LGEDERAARAAQGKKPRKSSKKKGKKGVNKKETKGKAVATESGESESEAEDGSDSEAEAQEVESAKAAEATVGAMSATPQAPTGKPTHWSPYMLHPTECLRTDVLISTPLRLIFAIKNGTVDPTK
jgi:hypothetical protein